MATRQLARPECRQPRSGRWLQACNTLQAAVPAAFFAGALLLAVHTLSVFHSSSHSHWDADVAFGSGPGPLSGGSQGAGGSNRLEILMRSLGNKRHRRQAVSMPAGLSHARRASLPPPRLAAAGTGGAGGAGGGASAKPSPSTLFVTFGNSAYFDFTRNWVLSVERMGVPFVVGALDKAMSQKCLEAGFPVIDLWHQEVGGGHGHDSLRVATSLRLLGSLAVAQAERDSESGDTSSFFRSNFTTFRNMGATKVQFTLSLLEADNGHDTIVVSDSDTVWFKDPTDYFEQHSSADWFISTDCLSHELEVAWAPGHNQPRCGHIPYNIWGRAYNTGVFAARNRPAARHLLELWRDFLLDPSRATTMAGNTTVLGITDQLALNMLLEEGSEWKLDPDPEDPRTTLLCNDTVRVHPLPVLHFPSGHVAFVQRLPWRHGVEPYVVHATFQRFSTGLSRYGKRGRFRQFGMWLADGPEYYQPPGAQYLSYQNDVRRYIDDLTASQFNGTLPVMYKHIIAVSYQLALFRDALAVARMLNRTIVLPESWCWCDYDWTPHVVERCKIRGSDLHLPFECPADFVFHIPEMDLNPIMAPAYRVPGFLEDPRAPAELRLSRAEVRVADRPSHRSALLEGSSTGGSLAAAGAATEGSLSLSDTATGVLYMGAVQQDVLEVAAPLQSTAVVELSNMRPGLLRGFDRVEDSLQFDELYHNITEELYWCCAAENDVEKSSFWYALPQSFGDMHAHGYAAWEPPVMLRPAWCDSPSLSELEGEWVAYPNHPCQFLANATAAAIAAALS